MPQQDTLNVITQIKKTLENFMVSIGIISAIILMLYFFTYGALVDAVGSSLIWFEVVTSIMVVFVLIFLKRVCFVLTRFKLGRRAGYATVFGKLVAGDLSLDEDVLLNKLAENDLK